MVYLGLAHGQYFTFIGFVLKVKIRGIRAKEFFVDLRYRTLSENKLTLSNNLPPNVDTE